MLEQNDYTTNNTGKQENYFFSANLKNVKKISQSKKNARNLIKTCHLRDGFFSISWPRLH